MKPGYHCSAGGGQGSRWQAGVRRGDTSGAVAQGRPLGYGRAAVTHRIAVVQLPGSNADWDALHALRDVLGLRAGYVFHKERRLGDVDAVVVPGGFSYGDYLRPGAIARFSPIMEAVVAFAKAGGPVLGICNGFQILTEVGLLPGALTRNQHLRFECRDVWLRVESEGAFTGGLKGRRLRMPIAHADGRYHCDRETWERLLAEDRVALRYVDESGEATEAANPNGSLGNVAGIYGGPRRNVLGMMPHPERACERLLGSDDGRLLLQAMVEFVRKGAA